MQKAYDQCSDFNIQVTGNAFFQGCWYNHYCNGEVPYCTTSENFCVLWYNFTDGDFAQAHDRGSNGEWTRLVF